MAETALAGGARGADGWRSPSRRPRSPRRRDPAPVDPRRSNRAGRTAPAHLRRSHLRRRPVAAPRRSTMPMDTGPKMMAQAAQAKLDIATFQPKLATATARTRRGASSGGTTLTARPRAARRSPQPHDRRARAPRRRGSVASAAQAYTQSGGGRVERRARRDARAPTTSSTSSRDVHLISTYGDYETRPRRTTRSAASASSTGRS